MLSGAAITGIAYPKARDAVHLALEISLAIAIDVARYDPGAEVELTRHYRQCK